jgi:hypothetical protein
MVGRRKERGFLRLPALVAPFGITLFSTDGWGTYERHGDTEQHAGGKEPHHLADADPTLSAPDDLLFADGMDARSGHWTVYQPL